MKVPISWLKDYVDITMSIEELAERLTLAGLEVASIEYIGIPQGDPPEDIKLPPSDHLVWDREKIVLGAIREVKAAPQRGSAGAGDGRLRRQRVRTVRHGRAEPVRLQRPGAARSAAARPVRARRRGSHRRARRRRAAHDPQGEANCAAFRTAAWSAPRRNSASPTTTRAFCCWTGTNSAISRPARRFRTCWATPCSISNCCRTWRAAYSIVGVAREVAALTGAHAPPAVARCASPKGAPIEGTVPASRSASRN